MNIESDKNQNRFRLHIGTKEFISIVILIITILIALKPDSFAIVIDKITTLANVPGIMDFVSAITTKAIQNR